MKILTTQPHGAHELFIVDADENVSNSIFELVQDGKQISFTGQELTNFATQWLEYNKQINGDK